MEEEIRKQYSNEDMIVTETSDEEEYFCSKHNLRKPHQFNDGDLGRAYGKKHCPNCLVEEGVLCVDDERDFKEDEIVIHSVTEEAYGVHAVLDDTRAFEYSLDTVPGMYRTVASLYEQQPNNAIVVILYELSNPSVTYPVPASIIEPCDMVC
jgi:hypothetical protein